MPGDTLSRLRIALTVFFALDGFVFAGWVVRIPAIKEQTGASASALGLALLGVSAGAVVTMMLTGRLCHRYGNHRVTVACAVLLSLSVTLPPLTHSAPALAAVLLLFGAAYGGINVAFNSAAVDLVAALDRPIMPTFHAAFSLGGMIGAGLGGLVADSLSPSLHLLGLCAVGLLVTALAGPTLLREAAPGSRTVSAEESTGDSAHATHGTASASRALDDGTASASRALNDGTASAPQAPDDGTASAPQAPHGRTHSAETPSRHLTPRTRRLVVVFGLIALCTAYGEGALADWGALHLQQDLDTSPGLAAAGYSCFALAMTVGRLSGTALLQRLGRTRTVVAGGATAAVGMLVASLTPAAWAALLGFAVTGLGLANIFPVAVERAGALAGPTGVAVASTLGYGGMLLGPPAIGFMADWFSLPVALTSVAALAATAALIGLTIRRAGSG
ncbi:MFS transporter [Streptomyces sp. NPDC058914]|uniref:MFS transporter n=1 Tax=Streptomyces sp. NPDC058914 TaxID=3346671 RepID=UPI0036AE87BB